MKTLLALLLLVPNLVKADYDKKKEDISFLCENRSWSHPWTYNVFLDEGYVEIPDEKYDEVYKYDFNYSEENVISFTSILDVDNYYHENTNYLNLVTGTLQGIVRERINGELDDGELITLDEECINLTVEKENEIIEANISQDEDRYRGKRVEFINIPVRICYSYAGGGCEDWSLRGGIYFGYDWYLEMVKEVIQIFFILPFEPHDRNDKNYYSFEIDRDDLFCRIDEMQKAKDWIEIALKNNVDLEKGINEDHIGCSVYPNLIVQNVKNINRPRIAFNFFTTEPDYDGTIWIEYDEFLEYSDFIYNSIGDLSEEAKKIIDAEMETDNLFN